MIYEYKCPRCYHRVTSTQRGDRLAARCSKCGDGGPLHRVFSVNMKPMMHEHFNDTLGAPISDFNRFKTELRIKGEKATEETGIEHRYAPVEWGDAAAVGATNEGIHESNVERSRRGEPLLPEVPS